MNHFVFLSFYFGAKIARHSNSLVVRRVSPGRIIVVIVLIADRTAGSAAVCKVLLEGRITVSNNFTKRRQNGSKIGTRDKFATHLR